MSNVELVIKIPESRYRLLQTQARTSLGREKLDEFAEAVLNSTPLPKGHGRLIDADKLVPDGQEDFVYYDDDEHNVFTAVGIAQIECADTIIEADTESEVGNERH